MKRILSVTLILSSLLLCLVSCNWFGDGNGDESEKDGYIWSSEFESFIVCEEQTKDTERVRTHVLVSASISPKVISPDENVRAHEIVFGDVGREISDEAYSRLDRRADLLALRSQKQSAYLIYAHNGSLAIAYSDIYARAIAVDYIVENLKVEHFTFEGVVAYDLVSTADIVDGYRKEAIAKEVSALRVSLSDETVDAIERFYALYGSELYIWLANLYDPDIGGFYYSGSARNTEGFLPDLESTGQALSLMDNSGLSDLYGGGWEDMLPESVTKKLGEFVVGLQHDDGYFYHPQWGTSVGSSRRGRDAGWAVDVLKALNITPNYDTASGSLKGKNPIKQTSKMDLTVRLGSSSVVAVSTVVPTAAGELASEEAFKTYLDNANISKNSYSTFNNLNSRVSEIKKAGLWDFLLKYLRDHQFENGLWEPEVTYQSVNGLMKVSTFFNSTIPFPRPEAAIESAMSIIELDPSDEIEGIVYVYNPWVAVYNILPYCEDGLKEEYRQKLANPTLIGKTFEKLAVFKRTDGGFSYKPTTSSHMSQGEHVAVEGTEESDVNATGISISILNHMLKCFKVTPPSLYYEYDTVYFLDNITGLGTLVKDPFVVEEPEVITFENYDPEAGGEFGGVVKYPADNVQNNIGTEDIDENGNYRWFTSSVVENPDPDKYDKVLYAADKVNDTNGNGKAEDNMAEREMATTGSNTEFYITNYPINGNCYVFETDLYFAGADKYTNLVAQIMFVKRASSDSSATLNVYKYSRDGKDYLRIAENFAGADGIKDGEVVSAIPTGEWFKLRIELYKEYDVATSALQIKMKFFVNGEYAGSSDSGYYSTKENAYIERTISAVKFAYYRWGSSAFYLDNVYVAKMNKPYVEEGIPGDGNNEISSEKTVYDFADGIPSNSDFLAQLIYKDPVTGQPTAIVTDKWTNELDSQHGAGTKAPGVRYYATRDPKNIFNNVLRAYVWNTDSENYSGNIYVDDNMMSETANVYEAKFDYFFDDIPWLFAENVFKLGFLSKNGTKLASLTFAAKEIPEDNKNQSELVIKRDDGTVLDGITLHSDRWYSLKFEYYYNNEDFRNSRLKIYVLDDTDSYVCVYDNIFFTKAGVVCQLGFEFIPYKMRGDHYLDNLSFAMIDKEYSKESVKSLDSVSITGLASTSDGEEISLPDANDNRGTGLYVKEAEKYNETTDKILTTVGVEGNNTLDFTEVDGDGALRFTHVKDGESRFQFKADALNGSFVFETDIKFDVLPEDRSRGIQILGAKKVGDKGSVWSGATVNLVYSEVKGCYVLEAAGAEYAVTEGKWMNIRLEADGVTKGSKVRFYVDGKLYGISTLTDSISAIKAYEVLTPGSNSAGASFIGRISFDNTYVGQKLYESPVTKPEGGSDSNVSGDDMDGDGWDN